MGVTKQTDDTALDGPDVANASDLFVVKQGASTAKLTFDALSEWWVYGQATGTTQSINDDTDTSVTFDTEVLDSGGNIIDLVSDANAVPLVPSATYAGTYLVSARVTFASNATGYRRVALSENGSTIRFENASLAVSGAGTSVGVSGIFSLASTETVEVIAYQNSGGALNVTSVEASAVRVRS